MSILSVRDDLLYLPQMGHHQFDRYADSLSASVGTISPYQTKAEFVAGSVGLGASLSHSPSQCRVVEAREYDTIEVAWRCC